MPRKSITESVNRSKRTTGTDRKKKRGNNAHPPIAAVDKRDKSRTPKDTRGQLPESENELRKEQTRFGEYAEEKLGALDPRERAIGPIQEIQESFAAGGYAAQQGNLFNSGFLFDDTQDEKA